MNTFYLSLGSVLIGIIATLLVSRYYFHRTVSKTLTPYIQFSSSIFRGLDSSLRESLKITYKEKLVDDLLEIQFLIANTGVRAIRDVISPLSVEVPETCSLLDTAILYVSPAERIVRSQIDGRKVIFDFPLLNANEFFIVKLLLQGQAKPKDLKFTITVDDLPPILSPELLPPELLSDEKGQGRKFSPASLIIGIILLLIGFSIASLIYNAWPTLETGIVFSFTQEGVIVTSILIAGIPCLLLLVIGVMLIIGSFINFSIPRRKKFVVPSDMAKSWFWYERIRFHPYEEGEEPEKNLTKKKQ